MIRTLENVALHSQSRFLYEGESQSTSDIPLSIAGYGRAD
jgi:hypothetical protein